jgi:hypothetical protein
MQGTVVLEEADRSGDLPTTKDAGTPDALTAHSKPGVPVQTGP